MTIFPDPANPIAGGMEYGRKQLLAVIFGDRGTGTVSDVCPGKKSGGSICI
jgi:hypothetical protein